MTHATFTTEAAARLHLAEAGGYLWPVEIEGKQCVAVIDHGAAVELIGGVEGHGWRIAERALESNAARTAGLDSEDPPILTGPLVAEILAAGAADFAAYAASFKADGEVHVEGETAVDFLARVKAVTGRRISQIPWELDAEAAWGAKALIMRGAVVVGHVTERDGDTIVAAMEPGAISALLKEAYGASPDKIAQYLRECAKDSGASTLRRIKATPPTR